MGGVSKSAFIATKPVATANTVYESSVVKIDFLRIEKGYSPDKAYAYFDVTNKTNKEIKIECEALSFNGYCFKDVFTEIHGYSMYISVPGYNTNTLKLAIRNFNFNLVDISNISTVGGRFALLSNRSMYEDSTVKIKFQHIEKSNYSDNTAYAYFGVTNKTDKTIAIGCNSLSLNGFNYDSYISLWNRNIPPYSTKMLETTVYDFDFSSLDLSNTSAIDGDFEIISSPTFINVNLYNDINAEEYPPVYDKNLLYTDDNINIYFDYAKKAREDFEVYLTVQNKTDQTIVIQNENVVVNGRVYDDTLMSDNVLPYTTGNVDVRLNNTNIVGSINTIGGQFRIIIAGDTALLPDKDSYDIEL